MFFANDLYYQGDELFRILWTDEKSDLVACIAVEDDKGMPELMPYAELSSLVSEGIVSKSENDTYSTWPLETSLSASQRSKRDNNWELIEPLVLSGPQIFFSEERVSLLREKSKTSGAGLPTLYRLLRRYWQRGLCKNALLPDYRNCGAKGQSKQAGEVKRGRPSIDPDEIQGINIDEEARENIRISLNRHYLNQNKPTLAYAHGQLLKDFYTDLNHETGKLELRSEYPLLATYRYWAAKLIDLKDKKQKRLGATNYEKDHRPILSTSNMQVLGPGSRYQIDATIGDIYLVSRLRRNQIVGRPTIYLVSDVFSRMIVGMYVGLENPSWVGAMSAIANTASDKVAYCEQYGIEINHEDWPCTYMSSVILGDRAELLSIDSNRLVTELGVKVENSAPYRADWKGIIERKFKTIQAEFQPYVDGYVHKDFKTRTGRDYRLDAKWDIQQFTRIMIHLVLKHNSAHRIRGYDFEQAMVQDDLPAIALDLWSWGIKNRSGLLKQRDEKEVMVALMPQGRGLVTRRGIVFKNCYYSCDLAVKEGWFVQAKDKTWYVTLSYDPRDMTHVYYRPESGGYHVAQLTDKSRACSGMSLKEILQVQHLDNRRDHPDRPENRQSQLDLDTAIQQLVQETSEMAPAPLGSKASRVRDIRDNREQETRDQRKSEAFDLSEDKKDVAASVVDLHTGEELKKDYRYPRRKKRVQTPHGGEGE
ncbi:Mu transposase C-terminal domain-containing protein [Endozoicomonas acroporae]|uniref:Mu transposase C-terminal domain-containing protein n=1 Tax=Endozoicomonas acroporae TaxID=1701104 RepID=UPI0013D069B9|nr:Mu transposase C-terminal domain-containing protein [Endozoicomonas acroporae]